MMSWDIVCLHASQTKHKHKDTRKYGSASPTKLRNAFPFFFNSLSGQSLCDLYSARDSQRPYDGHLVMWSCGNLWPAIPYRIHIKRARKRCTERVIYLGQSCPNTRKWRVFFTPATGQIRMKFVALEIRPATYRNASGICGVLIKYMFLS